MLDDKYATLHNDDVTNLDAFLEGRDQKAYDDLMRIVHANEATNLSHGLA